MFVACVAGIAYGYNYCMAEFLTLSKSEVTVYMRRGKFYDPPDLRGPLVSGRRFGAEHADELAANMSTDYEESLRRLQESQENAPKSLSHAWVKSVDTRNYAERLTKFAGKVDAADDEMVITVRGAVTIKTTPIPDVRRLIDTSVTTSDDSGTSTHDSGKKAKDPGWSADDLVRSAEYPGKGGPGRNAEDSGRSVEYSGKSASDSGRSAEDSGRSAVESGRSAEYSGKSAEDSGRSAEYSGKSTSDSGRSASDSGRSASYSGRSASDSGRSESDSERSASDSGGSTEDSRRSSAVDSERSAEYWENSASDSERSAEDSGISTEYSGKSAGDSERSAVDSERSAEYSGKSAGDSGRSAEDSGISAEYSAKSAGDSERSAEESRRSADNSAKSTEKVDSNVWMKITRSTPSYDTRRISDDMWKTDKKISQYLSRGLDPAEDSVVMVRTLSPYKIQSQTKLLPSEHTVTRTPPSEVVSWQPVTTESPNYYDTGPEFYDSRKPKEPRAFKNRSKSRMSLKRTTTLKRSDVKIKFIEQKDQNSDEVHYIPMRHWTATLHDKKTQAPPIEDYKSDEEDIIYKPI